METKTLVTSNDVTIVTNPLREVSNSLENQMVAMGKALMRAKKSLTPTEYKLLVMSLTKIHWKDNYTVTNEVELDKKEIAEKLGIVQDENLSIKLRKMFYNLSAHSQICFDKSDGNWEDGVLIIGRRSTRGSIIVEFNNKFMPLLSNLFEKKDFVTIWANDIYGFDSKYSYLLFEELRLHADTTKTNYRIYSTKQLKELFDIPKKGKGSYMRPEEKGGFDRSNFEKKVLDVAIKEINEGQMVQILPSLESKGKYYIKVKKNGYVAGYQFKYYVKTRIVDAIEEDEQIAGQMDLSDYGV